MYWVWIDNLCWVSSGSYGDNVNFIDYWLYQDSIGMEMESWGDDYEAIDRFNFYLDT